MKIVYAPSYFDDFDNKLLYYQNFDALQGTNLEQRLYLRLEDTKESLLLFPQMGREKGRGVYILSLGKNKRDVFSKIELHYLIHGNSIVFLHVYHTSMNI